MIEDGHVALAYHIESIASNDYRGVFIDAYPQHFGKHFDHLDEVELPVASQQVLVDRHVLDERHSFDVIAHHDRVGLRVATRQI